MVILREFYTEYPCILNITVKYLVVTATWLSVFMHFAYKYNLFCSKTSFLSLHVYWRQIKYPIILGLLS